MLVKTIIKFSKEQVFSFFKGAVVLFFILPLVACPLWGQVVQKKDLTSSDYQLWGETHLDKISSDENWASYTTAYQNGSDTLFVRNSINEKTFFYAGAAHSIFTKNNYFICQSSDSLYILNLKTFRQQTIQDVLKYEFCAATSRLILLIRHQENSSLLIKSLDGDIVNEVQNAVDFSISPSGCYVMYSTLFNNESRLNLLDLKKPSVIKCLSSAAADSFTAFTWQRHGLALAYLKQSSDLSIASMFYYTIKDNKSFEFIPHERSDFPAQTSIYWDPFYKIVISDDLQSVFFSVKKNTDLSSILKESDVEIWNANDKWIYPQQQKNGNFNTSPKIALWLAQKNIFKQITTPELPKVMLTGNLENAILFNPLDYEPQFEQQGPSDYYIMNLKTFEKNIFLRKQEGQKRTVLPSPTGKFIAYFKDNNWWIYDIILKSHKNITAQTGIKFTAKNQMLAPESVCGSPGWSLNDDEFLMYDQYDIWAAEAHGNSLRRLTHGREPKIMLRMAEKPNHIGLDYMYDGSKTSTFNLDKTIILKGHGEDEKTGYFKLIPGCGQKPVVYKESFIDELNYGAKMNKFYFREQRFNLSPELKAVDKNSESKTIFKSNPQQEKYYWGRSELVAFQNAKKQDLKAVLIYPAHYDPQKKYPMIVNIYEIQSKEFHTFSQPSLYNENGFNAAVFSSEGYFVLLPDILLEQGNPGVSAADCVISVTKQIIGTGMVDPQRIGIMGHSFGGYEVSFIVTQTDLFAAAVPSGAITDLTSFYFNVNQNSGEPDMWRFQSEQWNMRKTPFETPLSYSANSPIVHAQKITAPLLIWSGKEDQQVNISQSLEFYLALRRLGKKSIMLLYPQEGHVITSTENQKDITTRILQWFDYFLKNKRSVDSNWITEGVM